MHWNRSSSKRRGTINSSILSFDALNKPFGYQIFKKSRVENKFVIFIQESVNLVRRDQTNRVFQVGDQKHHCADCVTSTSHASRCNFIVPRYTPINLRTNFLRLQEMKSVRFWLLKGDRVTVVLMTRLHKFFSSSDCVTDQIFNG